MVLAIANDSHLMADLPWIAESIQLRNIYTDPLNVLQAELLHRSRQAEKEGHEPDPRVAPCAFLPVIECKKPRNVLRGFHPLPGREKLIQLRC